MPTVRSPAPTAYAWLGLCVACAHAPSLGGALARADARAVEAHALGARRCAPRNLAMADSHLAFARLELKANNRAQVQRHLHRAEVHLAAARLRLQDSCTRRANAVDPPP